MCCHFSLLVVVIKLSITVTVTFFVNRWINLQGLVWMKIVAFVSSHLSIVVF